jgi:hypothetical protein
MHQSLKNKATTVAAGALFLALFFGTLGLSVVYPIYRGVPLPKVPRAFRQDLSLHHGKSGRFFFITGSYLSMGNPNFIYMFFSQSSCAIALK